MGNGGLKKHKGQNPDHASQQVLNPGLDASLTAPQSGVLTEDSLNHTEDTARSLSDRMNHKDGIISENPRHSQNSVATSSILTPSNTAGNVTGHTSSKLRQMNDISQKVQRLSAEMSNDPSYRPRALSPTDPTPSNFSVRQPMNPEEISQSLVNHTLGLQNDHGTVQKDGKRSPKSFSPENNAPSSTSSSARGHGPQHASVMSAIQLPTKGVSVGMAVTKATTRLSNIDSRTETQLGASIETPAGEPSSPIDKEKSHKKRHGHHESVNKSSVPGENHQSVNIKHKHSSSKHGESHESIKHKHSSTKHGEKHESTKHKHTSSKHKHSSTKHGHSSAHVPKLNHSPKSAVPVDEKPTETLFKSDPESLRPLGTRMSYGESNDKNIRASDKVEKSSIPDVSILAPLGDIRNVTASSRSLNKVDDSDKKSSDVSGDSRPDALSYAKGASSSKMEELSTVNGRSSTKMTAGMKNVDEKSDPKIPVSSQIDVANSEYASNTLATTDASTNTEAEFKKPKKRRLSARLMEGISHLFAKKAAHVDDANSVNGGVSSVHPGADNEKGAASSAESTSIGIDAKLNDEDEDAKIEGILGSSKNADKKQRKLGERLSQALSPIARRLSLSSTSGNNQLNELDENGERKEKRRLSQRLSQGLKSIKDAMVGMMPHEEEKDNDFGLTEKDIEEKKKLGTNVSRYEDAGNFLMDTRKKEEEEESKADEDAEEEKTDVNKTKHKKKKKSRTSRVNPKIQQLKEPGARDTLDVLELEAAQAKEASSKRGRQNMGEIPSVLMSMQVDIKNLREEIEAAAQKAEKIDGEELLSSNHIDGEKGDKEKSSEKRDEKAKSKDHKKDGKAVTSVVSPYEEIKKLQNEKAVSDGHKSERKKKHKSKNKSPEVGTPGTEVGRTKHKHRSGSRLSKKADPYDTVKQNNKLLGFTGTSAAAAEESSPSSTIAKKSSNNEGSGRNLAKVVTVNQNGIDKRVPKNVEKLGGLAKGDDDNRNTLFRVLEERNKKTEHDEKKEKEKAKLNF